MRNFDSNSDAKGTARYDQSFAYFREHPEEQKEACGDLLDATDAFLQLYVDSGMTPPDALGEMVRYLIQHYGRGSNLRE